METGLWRHEIWDMDRWLVETSPSIRSFVRRQSSIIGGIQHHSFRHQGERSHWSWG